VVRRIRKHYRKDIPIILRLDSGFFDQKLFKVFEELKIGYICAGKIYKDIREDIESLSPSAFSRYQKGEQRWDFVEFWDRRGTWNRSRRAIFCRPIGVDRQILLPFFRPETIFYTNLGCGEAIDEMLLSAGRFSLVQTESLIETYHQRGTDELIHRALKEFGSETLPFKRFAANAAFYYTMLLAFFLYETFKEDVCSEILEVTAYAHTLRRKVIDFAAKVVRHGGSLVLKVTQATWKILDFETLWRKSGAPPPFAWT
jgi:hypothetical protein